MSLRLFVTGLQSLQALELPPGAARHAQVRRLQPGDPLVLFDGAGQDWPATVLEMHRTSVRVQVGEPGPPAAAELPAAVTLAVGMPANERMDALVEKAAELGAAAVQPLVCERSVLRLAGERAAKRVAHWQAVATSACEQAGRARLMHVLPVLSLGEWLAVQHRAHRAPAAWVLSTRSSAGSWRSALLPGAPAPAGEWIFLSGPEGGLTPAEEAAANAAGFQSLSLGPRVLRADTAPLAALAALACAFG